MIGAALGWLLNSSLGRLLTKVGALVIGALLIFHMGERSARQEAAERALRDYRNTRRRMDDAILLDDPVSAREWLRQRGQR